MQFIPGALFTSDFQGTGQKDREGSFPFKLRQKQKRSHSHRDGNTCLWGQEHPGHLCPTEIKGARLHRVTSLDGLLRVSKPGMHVVPTPRPARHPDAHRVQLQTRWSAASHGGRAGLPLRWDGGGSGLPSSLVRVQESWAQGRGFRMDTEPTVKPRGPSSLQRLFFVLFVLCFY